MTTMNSVMRTFRSALHVALFTATLFLLIPQGSQGLDFSNFQVKGFEGKGPGEFMAPEGLILGPKREIVVADHRNNRIQVFQEDGTFLRFIPPPELPPSWLGLKKFPETASATADDLVRLEAAGKKLDLLRAYMKRPVGLAFDAKGRLYVSCNDSHKILILRLSDGLLLGTIGQRGAALGQFMVPMDIDISPTGLLAVADWGNKRVQILNAEGACIRELLYQEETKKGLRPIAGRGVHWLPTGELVVTYPTFHQIACWNVEGELLWRFGAEGSGRGELKEPSFITAGPNGNLLVSDTGNHRFVEITGKGSLVKNFRVMRGTSPGRLIHPRGMALLKDDVLVICDQGNNRLHFFQPGRAAVLLREAQELARADKWEEALPNIERVLYLLPNDQDAQNLMVNALHYFGDRAYDKQDYTRAEEYFRRVLMFQPEDSRVPQKLDKIFWAENQGLIAKVVFGIMALIFGLLVLWTLKVLFSRMVFGHA